jgi:DNA repair protein SbcC/Rad50
MIPIRLSLSGFLSYLEPVELDFTGIELACISGPNGAGKSSLLDAITWVLFGMARKRDDSLIHAEAKAAEVSLIFEYEGATYRVQRAKPRDKTAVLELQLFKTGDGGRETGDGEWKVLTERTLRETEKRIQEVLRLDYETFVNASFFLQGKADQFTQQAPGDRKRILSNILGLEAWEGYRQKAYDRRRAIEGEISNLDGRLQEITAELGEEALRKSRLAGLETELKSLSKQRAAHEAALESARRAAAVLAEQEKLVEALGRQAQAAGRQLEDVERLTASRKVEREEYAAILGEAGTIEAEYAAWQAARQELARWDEVAGRFHEQEKRREAPRMKIQEEKTRLEEAQTSLERQESEAEAAGLEAEALRGQIEAAQEQQAGAELRLAERKLLDESLQAARQRQADAKAENPPLKAEMEALKERITRLEAAEGATCPLCGQDLEPGDRERLVVELGGQGKEMGDRYRENQKVLAQAEGEVRLLEEQMRSLGEAEGVLQASLQTRARLESQLEMLVGKREAWLTSGQPRLAEIRRALAEGSYAPEARQELARVDAELKAIGYEAAEHDRLRQVEFTGRESEGKLRRLEAARATLQPLEREIAGLEEQRAGRQEEAERIQTEYQAAADRLAQAQAQAPDLYAAELVLIDAQEQENRLRLEMGAARQKVAVLDDLKRRQATLEKERETQAKLVGQYRQLERAFSKDGVPALLIEQALPQIEAKANEILDRLSGGNMTVHFVTQASYKDRKREDMKETLDIQIRDGAGMRDYEMFSGGEAFRVNFAIRLALSEVLAQRAGARLRTLVIDEGFGSQDNLGRQRLVEAINLVKADFAKVLVITHIDELKEAFPARIEVEKTDRGSRVRVI